MTSISAFHALLGPTIPHYNFFTAVDLGLSDESAHTKSKPYRNDTLWLNDITEIIGSESDYHFTAEEPPPPLPRHYRYFKTAGKSRSASAVSDGRDFPPENISTLNRAGRPRFLLKKARISTGESFRLLIHMEETDYPPPVILLRGDVSMTNEDGAA